MDCQIVSKLKNRSIWQKVGQTAGK